jgi:DNA-binding IclR family transcriptional regulator
MGMDYLMIVTAAGKSLLVLHDSRGRKHIVRHEPVTTRTGTHSPHLQHKRQHLFLSMAGPPLK